jgi:hypothetical protein
MLPIKVNTKEPRDGAKEFNTKACRNRSLKPLFHGITNGEIGKIINVDTNVDRGGTRNDNAIEKAGIMGALGEA